MSTYETVRPMVMAAGEILRGLYGTAIGSYAKERHELVSEADQRVDELLRESLAREFPGYGIYSEESEESAGDGEHRWIIDPLDGTPYFLCGVPHFGVSLSLEVGGRVTEAFVFNPVSDEFYYGAASRGSAMLNGKPIRCSSTASIDEARIGVGFSANKPKIDRYFGDWGSVLDSCQKGVGLLAPALNICNVACGRLDLFIDHGSCMEGHSGAALILHAAGGIVRNYDLTEWDHRTKGIFAANRGLGEVLPRSV